MSDEGAWGCKGWSKEGRVDEEPRVRLGGVDRTPVPHCGPSDDGGRRSLGLALVALGTVLITRSTGTLIECPGALSAFWEAAAQSHAESQPSPPSGRWALKCQLPIKIDI